MTDEQPSLEDRVTDLEAAVLALAEIADAQRAPAIGVLEANHRRVAAVMAAKRARGQA